MSQNAAHIVPYRVFVFVWVGLIALTGLTILISRIELGVLNIWAALSIACMKSGLVIYFFMHMKYEKLYYKVYFFITLFILAIFIGLTFSDVHYRAVP